MAAMVAALAGCGGGGGAGGDDDVTPDAGAGGDVTLVDQAGCHMLGDIEPPVAVPPHEGSAIACVVVQGPQLCFVQNERFNSCLTDDRIWFEWEPGAWFNVKMNDWMAVSSSHGEVTTQTNADSGILGIPPSTTVTATITHVADGSDWQVVFRMEDDYVVFDTVEPPGGW